MGRRSKSATGDPEAVGLRLVHWGREEFTTEVTEGPQREQRRDGQDSFLKAGCGHTANWRLGGADTTIKRRLAAALHRLLVRGWGDGSPIDLGGGSA